MKDELGKYDIHENLIQMQSKIKPHTINSSYIVHLVTIVKKDLKLDEKFVTRWRELKNLCKN